MATSKRYTIDVDGEPATATFDHDPTDEDIEAFCNLIRKLRRKGNDITGPATRG
jgi:hypothetical protein